MMRAMALPLNISAPADPISLCPPDLPSDWADIWAQILRARLDGIPAGRPGHQRLVHGHEQGWTLNGPCSDRSAALFALYKPLLDARQAQQADPCAAPWLVAQLGQSLDGFVATETGDSYYVTGPHSLVHLHRLRALCDAVLVGAGTVATDNPQLTTRRVPGPHAVRVVLDPAARLDGRARAFTDAQSPTLWLCDARHAAAARQRLAPGSAAEVVAVRGLIEREHSPCEYLPKRAVATLAERGLRLVFVEGGGVTVSRFFRANVLNRLHLVVAPVFIGEGRRGLQAPAHKVMADCPRPPARMLALGEDMLCDLDLGV